MIPNQKDVRPVLYNYMKYEIQQWTVNELLSTFNSKNLNLNPTYQRNDIWTEKAQKDLISSMKLGMPIPNFFLHQRTEEKYDIADGQQRTRAILAYINGEIGDNKDLRFRNEEDFLSYLLPVVVIDHNISEEEVRKFYVKVNNTGLRLNSPELTKSQYFNSKVLQLVEELSNTEQVKTLGLFNEKQESRMLDREFMEELTGQIIYGITEKKLAISKLYTENENISDKQVSEIKYQFEGVLDIFVKINQRIPLSETRYSQKNDFYTLFGLFKDHPLQQKTYNSIFNFLIKIQDDISPSNDSCQLLQEYAFNCITQSHGKTARQKRYDILKAIAFNDSGKLTKEQKALKKYYGLKTSEIVKEENILLIDPSNIKTKYL